MGAPTNANGLCAQGIEALKDRRFDAAAELLNRYLDAAPNDTDAELALAAARSGQGKHVAALTIFERHLEREPRSPSLNFNRGTTLERLGRKEDATKAYKMVLQLKPDHPKATQRLQALGGIAPPPKPARSEIIPTVLAVDDDEVDGGPRASRRTAKKDRWIHPLWLVALFLFAVGLTVLAGVLVSPYLAGRVAGELLLANIFLLTGIQIAHDVRRGRRKIPATLGYALTGIGAFAMIGAAIDPVASWARAKNIEEQRGAAAKVRADENRATFEKIEAQSRKRDEERRRNAIADLASQDRNKWKSACIILSGLSPDEHRTEVVKRLEGFLSDSDTFVVMFALSALEKWGTKDSLARIEPLLKSKDTGIRFRAERVVQTIRSRT